MCFDQYIYFIGYHYFAASNQGLGYNYLIKGVRDSITCSNNLKNEWNYVLFCLSRKKTCFVHSCTEMIA